MREKLETSGLTLDDAAELGITELAYQDTAELEFFKPFKSMKIVYFDVNGDDTGFFRIRYLVDAGMLKARNIGKYAQAPNTPPYAYFPLNQNWKELITDTKKPIIITEGELKAAKACKEGFPTIGLGGVWSWKSSSRGIAFLPELEAIDWKHRNVYICFDSDYYTNKGICDALQSLANVLQNRGALVFMVSLPALASIDKTGLDDFLVAETNADFEDLLKIANPLGLTRQLWRLNERYVFINALTQVVNRKTQDAFSARDFTTVEGHLKHVVKYLKPTGDVAKKEVLTAKEWLAWPMKCTAEKLTYAPGRPEFTEGMLNVWPGYGVEPKKGSVKLFTDLIDHLFTPVDGYGEADEAAKKWFLQWLAYPLQNPGTKLYSAVVLYSLAQGVGKSLIGKSLGLIYGKNYTEISNTELVSNFNGWADAKQFIVGDDVTGSDKREFADKLKKTITQETVHINKKYGRAYEMPDFTNYLFTSNDTIPFYIEKNDRRYFVHEITAKPKSDSFYHKYDSWLKSGGAANLFDWLLELDCSDFNPRGHAYQTNSRTELIQLGESDVDGWTRALKEKPDFILGGHTCDLYTSKELLAIFDIEGRGRLKTNGMTAALRRAGFRKANNNNQIVTKDNNKDRYFIVRNEDKWLEATHAELSEHINKTIGGKF